MKDLNCRALFLVAAFAFLSAVSLADHHLGVLNANTAPADAMAQLPHMNEALAGGVVSNRPFVTIGELNNLFIMSGVGTCRALRCRTQFRHCKA